VGAEGPPPRRRDKRRERGSGTVYFDASRSRWVGAITVNGKRRKVVAKTKTDASAALSKLVAARVTGAPVDDRAHTVAQAVATFLERELPARTSHNQPLAASTVERERWAADLIVAEIGILARRSVCQDSSSTLNVEPDHAAEVGPQREDGPPSGMKRDRTAARTHSRQRQIGVRSATAGHNV
jgi:hypothetical protein